MTRLPPSAILLETGVVAVLRADRADKYLPVVETLAGEGVRSIELTLTTPGTIEELASLAAAVPEAEIGVGTVLSAEDAGRAMNAGAKYLVTPSPCSDVIRAATCRGVPVYAGAFSPAEALANWDAGAAAIKVFPAATVGAEYVSHLHGPFPEMLTMPSGGVSLEDIPAWIRAGAIAVSLGGPLVGDALRSGNLGALRDRARAALEAVVSAREGA